jgi:hypothetical protein
MKLAAVFLYHNVGSQIVFAHAAFCGTIQKIAVHEKIRCLSVEMLKFQMNFYKNGQQQHSILLLLRRLKG